MSVLIVAVGLVAVITVGAWLVSDAIPSWLDRRSRRR